mmetsp:Transcript_3977/g.5962  ORF Transcript_3977/g.5962 Transcript_3977/m.5962 type:complete len:379 (+) Transcript_3977:26-1162(+)
MLSTYTTLKYCVIEDKRLAYTYWVLLVLVIMYGFFAIISERSYLEKDNIEGLLLPRLQRTRASHTKDKLASFPSYCGTENAECLFLDHFQVLYPLNEDNALTVTTSITNSPQSRNCDSHGKGCNKRIFSGSKANWKYLYPLAVENFTIYVHHEIQAPHFFTLYPAERSTWHKAAHNMHGTMVNQLGQEVAVFDNPAWKEDGIQIWELLAAAGIKDGSLDAINEGVHDPFMRALGPNGTVRYRDSGCIIYIVLEYTNIPESLLSFDFSQIRYRYRVQVVPHSGFYRQEVILEKNDFDTSERLIRNRRGVYIKFVQAGVLGRFNLVNLIVTIATIFGLIGISTSVVDALAEYVIPNVRELFPKVRYESVKLEKSKKNKKT